MLLDMNHYFKSGLSLQTTLLYNPKPSNVLSRPVQKIYISFNHSIKY